MYRPQVSSFWRTEKETGMRAPVTGGGGGQHTDAFVVVRYIYPTNILGKGGALLCPPHLPFKHTKVVVNMVNHFNTKCLYQGTLCTKEIMQNVSLGTQFLLQVR